MSVTWRPPAVRKCRSRWKTFTGTSLDKPAADGNGAARSLCGGSGALRSRPRARSSAGQSRGLIIPWSLVRIQAGPSRGTISTASPPRGEPGEGVAVRPRRVYRERQPAGGDSSSTAALGASPSARRHAATSPARDRFSPRRPAEQTGLDLPPDERTCRRPALPALRQKGGARRRRRCLCGPGAAGPYPSRPGAGRGCGRVLPPLVRHPGRVAAEARSLSCPKSLRRAVRSAGLSEVPRRPARVPWFPPAGPSNGPGPAPVCGSRPGPGASRLPDEVDRPEARCVRRGVSAPRHVPRAAVLMRVARRSRMTESQIESS